MAEPLITAIVSTYAAERFMAGCLEDLARQTLADRLEIVVIDACSPEGEGAIVRDRQRRHPHLRYLRTETREPSSLSFQRATRLARGRYLTTANVDDRHRPDFCELMTAALDEHPEFGLAYADSLITTVENETFAATTATRRYAWPDFTLATALSCCLFGAQPVWRREAHAGAGEWDPAHGHANDQDMFLRIAWRYGAVHLAEPLGLFLARPDSVSGADHREETLADVLAVLRKYRTAIPLEEIFPALRGTGGDPLARAAALFEMGNLCARGPYTDGRLALAFYRRAVEPPLAGAARDLLQAAFANNSACILAAAGAAGEAARAWRLAASLPEAARNADRCAAAARAGGRPSLRDLAFVEIAHPVVAASRRTRALRPDPAGRLAWTAPHEQLPWDVFAGPSGVPVAHPPRPVSPPPPEPAGKPPSPPHVLIVMYGWADSGGGTILPRQAALALAAAGARVSVFYAAARPRPGLPPYGLLRGREDGVDLVGLCNRPADFMDLAAPEREIDDPRVRAAFASLLDERRPDVVHFFNLHNLGFSLPRVCRERGVPAVYSSNNYWPLCPRLYLASERLELCQGSGADGRKCEACLGQSGTAGAHAARRRAALAMLNEDLDLHLAVSRRGRDLFAGWGADPGRIRVLLQQPPGADAIWRRTGARREIVADLDRPLRAAFVGSVLPHKGAHVLAQAVQALPPGAVEALVLGDLGGGYRALLERIDRRGALRFGGAYRQEDLPGLLAEVDVVVVPSIWDDCAPLVVAEALAARAPVLGSRMGGIPDFLADGVTGRLFPAGDAAALAERLAAFHRDRGLLGRMQRAIPPPRGFGAYIADLLAVYAGLPAPAPA